MTFLPIERTPQIRRQRHDVWALLIRSVKAAFQPKVIDGQKAYEAQMHRKAARRAVDTLLR